MPRTKGDIKCECGGSYSESTKQQHETTNRHKKLLEPKRSRTDKYYVEGKFSHKKYYADNKNKYIKTESSNLVKCDCGCIVYSYNLNNHKKTKTHQNGLIYYEQINNINKDEIL